MHEIATTSKFLDYCKSREKFLYLRCDRDRDIARLGMLNHFRHRSESFGGMVRIAAYNPTCAPQPSNATEKKHDRPPRDP